MIGKFIYSLYILLHILSDFFQSMSTTAFAATFTIITTIINISVHKRTGNGKGDEILSTYDIYKLENLHKENFINDNFW